MDTIFDVAIIGGGINGCGCAADAALRGLSVVLLEKDDLAAHTSSSSTKLIHGGLRYLERYEFSLVKKALKERQTLLTVAPHLVHPQPFVLPHQKHMRPAWLLRLGLFFYDNLTRKNQLPKCQSIHRDDNNQYFTPLIKELTQGFLFYDASTDDARLTIINALQAKNNGASIRPQSTVVKTEVIDNQWQLTIQPKTGAQYKLMAKTLINAAGPWVEFIAKMTQIPNPQKMTLVKGSHIVVPKLYEGQHAYLLQHADKRVVFVIPYYGDSMIGTTDVPFNGPLEEVQISEDEITYLISLVNAYFKKKLDPKDIIDSWSGIRPLLATDGLEVKTLSRDYSFQLSTTLAPIVTIYGGKITTYRQLSEEIINQLSPFFPKIGPCKTKQSPLPGATFGSMDFDHYVAYAKNKYQWLGKDLLERYLFNYGSCMEHFLSKCNSFESMGEQFGASLYQVEVDYLVQEEWAIDSEDVLKRRTKLILNMDAASQKKLAAYLKPL
ncbi:MAG: glycerol-3-phosphate dehydrogenase [Legionellales bacterium]